MITVLLLIVAIGILVWGYLRAKPFGKPGILAWMQTVVLMAPWLLFFGLAAIGLYLNLASILLLVVTSAGLYIYLGRRLRRAGADELAAGKAAAFVGSHETTVQKDAHGEEVPSEPSSEPSKVNADAALGGFQGEVSSAQRDSAQRDSVQRDSAQKTEELRANEGTSTPVDQAAEKATEAPSTAEPVYPIPSKDLAVIEGIFSVDTFFRTKTVPYQEGAIFRGNLRGQPDRTALTLNEKLADKMGDRYRAFLIADPENKPVVVVLPKEKDPQPTTKPQLILAVILAAATLATCLETSSILQRFDVFQSPQRLPEALPVALGIVSVLVAHELGHRLIASRRQVKLSPPFFLPAWQLGAFGSLMRFESILPQRKVLFDVAFAGPAAGGLLSFLLLFIGLVLSHPGSQFQLPAEFLQGSILVGTLARAVLGEALQADLVDVHPLMIIGWIGLIITAINVIPAGQLDGGRMVQAIYGRKTLVRTTTVALVLLALVGLFNPLALYWAVLILFLQRQPERPCIDDLSEPDDARAALALLSLFLMLLVLLPLTPSLAMRLGIG